MQGPFDPCPVVGTKLANFRYDLRKLLSGYNSIPQVDKPVGKACLREPSKIQHYLKELVEFGILFQNFTDSFWQYAEKHIQVICDLLRHFTSLPPL